MSQPTLRVELVQRTTAAGLVDEISLSSGVNVIVGLKDTGKSGWLDTISFLLGDTDVAEVAMGTALAQKFSSARMVITLGEGKFTIERRWHEPGSKHRTLVDGEGLQPEEFSIWLLAKLGIPSLTFPKGNPYSGQWPRITWRMLFRHVYREERHWSDLADKQTEREQHACVLQFLGAAERLYPAELATEIGRRKNLDRLKARKEQFDELLARMASTLLPGASVTNSPTRASIDRGVQELEETIERLQADRTTALETAIAIDRGEGALFKDRVVEICEKRLAAIERRARIDQERSALAERRRDLVDYEFSVSAELNRMKRLEITGTLLAPLKVSACPNCDQPVSAGGQPEGSCFLCRQKLPIEHPPADWSSAKGRIAFELDQLEAERKELGQLIAGCAVDIGRLLEARSSADSEIADYDALLRPSRAAISGALPPRLTEFDTKSGQLEERQAQLRRLTVLMDERDALAEEIDRLAIELQGVESVVEAKAASIPFEKVSDAMSDGINEYLNMIREKDKSRWEHGKARLRVGERALRLRVGDGLDRVGASSNAILLLAYHFALLRLSGLNGYHYPGLALIDFPLTLADGTSIGPHENYLVEPFVELAKRNGFVQAIIAGRAFESLEGATRIELLQVWKQGHDNHAG